jgi:hypothetical protein
MTADGAPVAIVLCREGAKEERPSWDEKTRGAMRTA